MGTETWLSLDLSHATGSLAIHRAEPTGGLTPLAHCDLAGPFTHSEALLDTLDGELNRAGVQLASIDRYLTTSGPGSFTGLRIALATLKGFALAHRRPLELMSGGEARARSYVASHPTTEDRLHALSPVAAGRFAVTTLKRNAQTQTWELQTEQVLSPEEIESLPPGVWLLEGSRPVSIPQGGARIDYPLKAAHLASVLTSAQSRTTHSGLSGIITAAPRYFGETRYRTFNP